MRLVKLLIILVTLHLGMGFTQMVVSYFAGDVENYGAAGWVSHTPIGTFIELDERPDERKQCEINFGNVRGVIECANDLGDMINGLASFGYGFLEDIAPDQGLVYMLVVGFRLVSVLIWIGTGFALLYFLFDSNLLTSKLGLAMVGLGLGLGALSTIGLTQQ